jgi:hypothetical protein
MTTVEADTGLNAEQLRRGGTRWFEHGGTPGSTRGPLLSVFKNGVRGGNMVSPAMQGSPTCPLLHRSALVAGAWTLAGQSPAPSAPGLFSGQWTKATGA